jgi:hypothetical protein
MLRGNWSSTIKSASVPSSLSCQSSRWPASAAFHVARKRRRISASNASSFLYQRSYPASRQNVMISVGVTLS